MQKVPFYLFYTCIKHPLNAFWIHSWSCVLQISVESENTHLQVIAILLSVKMMKKKKQNYFLENVADLYLGND